MKPYSLLPILALIACLFSGCDKTSSTLGGGALGTLAGAGVGYAIGGGGGAILGGVAGGLGGAAIGHHVGEDEAPSNTRSDAYNADDAERRRLEAERRDLERERVRLERERLELERSRSKNYSSGVQ